MKVNDELLIAFVDGECTVKEAAAVETALAKKPELRVRAATLFHQRLMLAEIAAESAQPDTKGRVTRTLRARRYSRRKLDFSTVAMLGLAAAAVVILFAYVAFDTQGDKPVRRETNEQEIAGEPAPVPATPLASARLIRLRGKAFARSLGQSEWHAVAEEAVIPEGASFRMDSGKAAFRLAGGGFAYANERAHAVFANEEIGIEAGQFFFDYSKAGAHPLVRTRDGLIRHVGTGFDVDVTPAATIVTVAQGKVEVSNRRGSQMAYEGTQVSLKETEPPVRPQPVPGNAAWAWLEGVAEGEVLAAMGNLPAFPGAAGFGTTTPGGRGGKVLFVTSLEDAGPGTFREGCEARGPRILVFRTGGLIELKRDVRIRNPFITIAGQTAPGDGICLKGASLRVQTHDVVIRGLRVRPGLKGVSRPDNLDGISIEYRKSAPFNVVVDHCSVSWCSDSNYQTWYPCRDITFQWCISSEALDEGGGHPGWGMQIADEANRVSVHHCLFVANPNANPIVSSSTTEIVNNVVAGWTRQGTLVMNQHGRGGRLDLIGNTYISDDKTHSVDIRVFPGADYRCFLQDNTGIGRNLGASDWALARGGAYTRASQNGVKGSGLAAQKAADALTAVMMSAGATVPARDMVDQRAIESTRTRVFRIYSSAKEAGGWPTYRTGTPPQDTDSDGIPDNWEAEMGLSPDDPSDANSTAPSGYTWIEEFINRLIDMPERSPTTGGDNEQEYASSG